MSEMIRFEVLDHDDVRSVVWEIVGDACVATEDFDERTNEWVDYNLSEWIYDHFEILDEYNTRQIAEEEVERALNAEALNTDALDARVTVIEDENLVERVEQLERVNAKLLDTLSQFAQLLNHRDLI